MFENKNELDNENTIHYYKPNRVLPNIMIVIEIIYCIICMALYLILIYWSSQNEPEVILGQEKPEINLDDYDAEYEGLALVPNYINQKKLWQYD